MTRAPFASLEFRLASIVNARLSNAECQANGAVFGAMLDTSDRTVYDAVTVGDYTLRYLTADVVLEEGDALVVAGVDYVVAAAPQQINAYESVAPLRRDD